MDCPECEKSTGNKCSLHVNGGFGLSEPFGQWIWEPYPVCVVCKKPSEITIVLPYGSDYDGEHLCSECTHRIIDPEIKKACPT